MVHAGLDLLRSDWNADAVELLNDVYSASEAAISILNDLLCYENIDAGSEMILQASLLIITLLSF